MEQVAKKKARLTRKQQKFADNYLKTGNGSESAKKVYAVSTDESARAVASQNLTKPSVQEYLKDKGERALEIIYELAEEAKQENVRLGAAKDLADRGGHKPIEKSVSLSAVVEVESSHELLALTAQLNDNIRGTAKAPQTVHSATGISRDGVATDTVGDQTQG